MLFSISLHTGSLQKINEHTSPTRARTYLRLRAHNGEASG